MELSKLAEKDPEFYKYLQENDQELLDFNLDDAAPREEDEEEDEEVIEEDETPVLTKEILQRWQKALLEVRSPLIRVLRWFFHIRLSASVPQGSPKTVDSVPVGCTYERGGPSAGLEGR